MYFILPFKLLAFLVFACAGTSLIFCSVLLTISKHFFLIKPLVSAEIFGVGVPRQLELEPQFHLDFHTQNVK